MDVRKRIIRHKRTQCIYKLPKHLELKHDSLHIPKVIARVGRSQNKPNMSNAGHRQLSATKYRSTCRQNTKDLATCTTPTILGKIKRSKIITLVRDKTRRIHDTKPHHSNNYNFQIPSKSPSYFLSS